MAREGRGQHTRVNPAGTRKEVLSNWPIRTWFIMLNLFAKARLNPGGSKVGIKGCPSWDHGDPPRNADPELL